MRKSWLFSLGLLMALVSSAYAFSPAGWVYFNYPWAYDNNTRDWYWFNTADTQWIAHMETGQWAKLQNSALASGWVYFTGNFAYAQGNSAWHWVNTADTQWVVNMRTGAWSRFGQAARRLLTWTDVLAGFQGTFSVPLAQSGDYRFSYASGVHEQLENGDLLVDGHPYYSRQARLQLPSVLDGSEGTRVGEWIDITGGILPAGWPGGEPGAILTGGFVEVDGHWYFTKYEWYNGDGTDWQTQGVYSGALDGSGTVSGLWTLSNPYGHHSRAGGYVSKAPGRLQDEGYRYLAGQQGTSGAATGRWGPNLFAINPVPESGALPALTLIAHPSEGQQAPAVRAVNATGTWWVANRPANEAWWVANRVTDMKWIETASVHGVICFVYRGIGNTWYGAADGGPGLPDPYGGGSGYHAEGWALQVWIYDPDDLIAVSRGERDPWSLAPAEAVLLTERLPGADSDYHYSAFTGSARTECRASFRDGRLIILQENEHPVNEWENAPKGYVFNLP